MNIYLCTTHLLESVGGEFAKYLLFSQPYCPHPENHFKPITPLQRSKPEIPIHQILEASTVMPPFPFDDETDMPVDRKM